MEQNETMCFVEAKPLQLLQEEGYRLLDKELKELENKGDILRSNIIFIL